MGGKIAVHLDSARFARVGVCVFAFDHKLDTSVQDGIICHRLLDGNALGLGPFGEPMFVLVAVVVVIVLLDAQGEAAREEKAPRARGGGGDEVTLGEGVNGVAPAGAEDVRWSPYLADISGSRLVLLVAWGAAIGRCVDASALPELGVSWVPETDCGLARYLW